MTRRRIAWCVIAGIALCSPTPNQARGVESAAPVTRRALLVGIDQYLPARSGVDAGRSVTDLDGAINDVEALRAVLVARFGFKTENVHVLRNGEATRDRIFTEMRNWLVSAGAKGDVGLFFYAGHGSQVRNSKSKELDGMDESIVPADARLGRPDIRDKEFAALFDSALDKGIVLTAIFDSCHSGSISRGVTVRGRSRFVPADPRDAADSAAPVPPELRGALILSAAQDLQSADEIRVPDEGDASHGLFTWALVKTLRTMPVNESADRMFLRVRSLMQSESPTQEPVEAGSDERKHATWLGSPADASTGTMIAVQSVESDGTIVLQGGLAAGILAGAELKDWAGAIVLRVTSALGPAQSRAQVISGRATDVRPGDLYVLTKWGAPSARTLRLWAPSVRATSADVRAQATAIRVLSSDRRITWVVDPELATKGFAWLQATDAGWRLAVAGRDPIALGSAAPAADDVVRSLAPVMSAPAIMADLALPAESRTALQNSSASDGLLALASEPAGSDYVLVGRVRDGLVEYAWVRANGVGDPDHPTAIPAITRWVPLGDDPAAVAAALRDLAIQLSVVRNWLELESPPDTAAFPYHLALKKDDSGELKTGGQVIDGDHYHAVLTLDESLAAGADLARRYIYAFTIGDTGTRQLIFPSTKMGNVENLLPLKLGLSQLPKEIPLGQNGQITVNVGIDTFLLLTSATALPDLTVLEGDAVRSAPTRSVSDPLTLLLAGGRGATRGGPLATPLDWSIERFTLRTVARSPGR